MAILALADGSLFQGRSVGYDGLAVGELVFNTSMTGYQEILTDPSYAEQIVALTCPHIGNVGCNQCDAESDRVWAKGLIIRDDSLIASNYRSDSSLRSWLQQQQVVAIAECDTRHLTHHLREHGAQAACISSEDDVDLALAKAREFGGLSGLDLACRVSTDKVIDWNKDPSLWRAPAEASLYHVVVYDFGVKHTILRILLEKGCRISLVPAKTPAKEVLSMQADGVLLSNGPGDPAACDYAIKNIEQLLKAEMPLLGICLGFQLLVIACGGQTVKMKFGHHGANHPVLDLIRQKVFITSQNHGFEVDEQRLPDCLTVTHRSLFDQSVQGLKHDNKPAFGFQGHPEASPGPHEMEALFEQFISSMALRGKGSE